MGSWGMQQRCSALAAEPSGSVVDSAASSIIVPPAAGRTASQAGQALHLAGTITTEPAAAAADWGVHDASSSTPVLPAGTGGWASSFDSGCSSVLELTGPGSDTLAVVMVMELCDAGGLQVRLLAVLCVLAVLAVL